MHAVRELTAAAVRSCSSSDGGCGGGGGADGTSGGGCGCAADTDGGGDDDATAAAQLRPFDLTPGEIALWWGHRLKYGFVGSNETGQSVVGFDFHIIPWAMYKECRQDGKRSSHSLRLGSYYSVMDARGPQPAL